MTTQWPHDFRDCFHLNQQSGLYKISASFREAAQDIRRIGVTKDFFDHYPELRHAVRAVDELPRSLPAKEELSHLRGYNGFDTLEHPQRGTWSFSDKAVTKTRGPGMMGMLGTLLDASFSDCAGPWDDSILHSEMSYISGRDFL